MSTYLVLLYRDEAQVAAMGPDERAEMLAAHQAFRQRYGSAVGLGQALQMRETACSIRRGEQGLEVTDGPFAETKEALGGFYVIEADDLDAAVKIAADVPVSPGSGVEVRPVMVFG